MVDEKADVEAGVNEGVRTVTVPISQYPAVFPQIKKLDELSLSIAGKLVDEHTGLPTAAPLVSFVVINWNYGSYVGQAIDSIRAQDYPNFECLVIDNGSTDDSREVIAKHVSGDDRFSVEHLPENLGQLGAAMWALGRIRGSFVTFVDADDILFSSFASTHLQVHLALSRNVAVTSSNLITIGADGAIISGGYPAISRYANSEYAVKGVREPNSVVRLSTVSDDAYALLDSNVWVLSEDSGGWLWGPGTSNMLRRSFIDMAVMRNADGKYMRAADNHFNVFCHAMGGTTLIDIPLSAYRVHDRNYYTEREPISGSRHGKRGLGNRQADQARQTLELLLAQADHFSWVLGNRYWQVVDLLARAPSKQLRAFYGQSETEELFTRHAETLRSVFGERELIKRLRGRFSMGAAQRIFRRGTHSGRSASFVGAFYAMEFDRFFRRVIRGRR
jgi:glycosyltransferase involved in cell wall biosynthesis